LKQSRRPVASFVSVRPSGMTLSRRRENIVVVIVPIQVLRLVTIDAKSRQPAGKAVDTLRTDATVVTLGGAAEPVAVRQPPPSMAAPEQVRRPPHLSSPARDTPAGPPTFTPTPERHAQHPSSPADLWDHKDPRPSHPVLKQNPSCKDQGRQGNKVHYAR